MVHTQDTRNASLSTVVAERNALNVEKKAHLIWHVIRTHIPHTPEHTPHTANHLSHNSEYILHTQQTTSHTLQNTRNEAHTPYTADHTLTHTHLLYNHSNGFSITVW